MIYLASPYSNPDPEVRRLRFEAARDFAATWMARRIQVFSPIVYTHEVAERFTLPGDHVFWLNFNSHMIRHSSEVAVLRLSGWQASRGVQHEVQMARTLDIPVTFHDPL